MFAQKRGLETMLYNKWLRKVKMCGILVTLCVFDGQPCRRKFFLFLFCYFLWKANTGKMSANVQVLHFWLHGGKYFLTKPYLFGGRVGCWQARVPLTTECSKPFGSWSIVFFLENHLEFPLILPLLLVPPSRVSSPSSFPL